MQEAQGMLFLSDEGIVHAALRVCLLVCTLFLSAGTVSYAPATLSTAGCCTDDRKRSSAAQLKPGLSGILQEEVLHPVLRQSAAHAVTVLVASERQSSSEQPKHVAAVGDSDQQGWRSSIGMPVLFLAH
jgi:hypothetical protein